MPDSLMLSLRPPFFTGSVCLIPPNSLVRAVLDSYLRTTAAGSIVEAVCLALSTERNVTLAVTKVIILGLPKGNGKFRKDEYYR
jgi:hypothetical protein